jgi:hypothetical protein
VNVRLCEKDLAVEAFGRRSQSRCACRVRALEKIPSKPARSVFVVEQIDEAVGRRRLAAEPATQRRLEVTLQRVGEGIERRRLDPGRHRRGDAFGQEVVRQHHARSARHALDLVPAVGVEGDELQIAAVASERHDLAVLLDGHLPAAE